MSKIQVIMETPKRKLVEEFEDLIDTFEFLLEYRSTEEFKPVTKITIEIKEGGENE